jgi:hypothetical protein
MFLVQVSTMYTGVKLDTLNLGRSGLDVLIPWTIWCIIVRILLEIIQIKLIGRESEEGDLREGEEDEEKMKAFKKMRV